MKLLGVTFTRINGKMVASVSYEPEKGDTFAELRKVAEGMLDTAEGSAAEPTADIPEAVYRAAAEYADKKVGTKAWPNDIERIRGVLRNPWQNDPWSNAVREYFDFRAHGLTPSTDDTANKPEAEDIITLLREADKAPPLVVAATGRHLVRDLAAAVRQAVKERDAAVADAKNADISRQNYRAKWRDVMVEASGARNHLRAVLDHMWPVGTTAPAPVRAARDFLAGNAPQQAAQAELHRRYPNGDYAPVPKDIPEAVYKAAADAANKVTKQPQANDDIACAQHSWETDCGNAWGRAVCAFIRGYLYALGNGPA